MQFRRNVKLQQLPQGYPSKGAKPSASLIMKKIFGFITSKALDHTWGITRITFYAKHARAGRI